MHPLVRNVVQAAERMTELGMVFGLGGNISARQGGEVAITRSGSDLSGLTEGDVAYCPMGLPGEVTTAPVSSEWRMHQMIYGQRTDATVILHAHLRRPVVLEAMKKPLRFFTLDHVYGVGGVASCGYEPSGSVELARAVSDLVEHQNAVILGYHGVVAVGAGVSEAIQRLHYLDDAAQATLEALATGDETSGISPEIAATVTAI